jgi:glutamyl-tRNA reductase
MSLLVIGLSHKTAPVELRERLAFPENRLEEPLLELKGKAGVREDVILSTCNRVEIYSDVEDAADGEFLLKEYMAHYHKLPLSQFDDYLYCFADAECVHHTFKVASSLDSMIVGEVQILGQLKDAYEIARRSDCTGAMLNQLFERAFFTAKKVRTETGIAQNAVSISYAAVELAKKIFGDLSDKSVMLVGAGEMAELAARHLVSNGAKTVVVSNRTFNRAVELAKELNGSAIRFVVISSTGAPHHIITRKHVKDAIRARKNRPIFFIDIAVPRDVDPEVNGIENVYLYDIDDLEKVIEYNIKEREREAKKAEAILQEEVEKFIKWQASLDVVPTIVSLREKLESIREAETRKALSRLKNLSREDRKAVEALTSAMINKILHHPTVVLKKTGQNEGSAELIQTVRRIFDLDEQ